MNKGIFRSLITGWLLLTLPQLASVADLASTLKILETGIEITIQKKLPNNTLKLAPFNNPVKTVTLVQEETKSPLKIKPFPTHWEISVPASRKLLGSKIFIETIGKPHLAGKAIINTPDKTGTISLPAHQAIVIGNELRYEPQPNKNTLGYWRDPEDYPEWLFQVPKPGKYRVVIHQGCGADQGGSTAELRLGEETLKFKVKDTGSFQTFEARKIGTLKVESTEVQSLQIHITRLAKKAAMDLRLIELIPLD